MSPSNTLSLAFSVLDGDEPKHWKIWSADFITLERMVRGVRGEIQPFLTQSEFYLLDQTPEQLDTRDSWANVVGTLLHITDETHLRHQRSIHGRICSYLKKQSGALCKEVGYYILPVAELSVVKDKRLSNYTVDFLKDAQFALGKYIAAIAPRASSARDLQNSLEYIAERIIILREAAQDQ